MADIRIGCSGWHYKHWLGPFYPPGTKAAQMLPHYLRYFDTVEINNSFYRLPTPETFATWRANTPANFQFAVKGSRYLTHMKKLKEPDEGIERLSTSIRALGDKLGVVLFQLPPGWKINLERLEEFLSKLPRWTRYTFEFREQSWLTQSVYDLLERYNAAFCIYDLAGFHSPIEVTADFAYVRLHGPSFAKYQGSYSDAVMREWARRIEKWQSLDTVYVYFDNDDSAYAVDNAITLKKMVASRAAESPVAARAIRQRSARPKDLAESSDARAARSR